MTLEQIKLLIKEGEGLTVEFKERYTPRIDQDIVAFSNSKGGVILLGITDESKTTGEKLTGKLKAEILNIAKNVGKYFMHSQITLLLFKDHNKVEFLDRKHVRDDLFTQFKEAMVFVEKHLNRRSKIVGVNRVDTYEVPIEAVREAVANAIIHRDYSMTGTDIMIEIYPDTLEISNPGGLASGIKKEELGKKSVRRNELIADLFFRMDKIEKVGTGINRIRDAVKKAGLKEPVFESDSFFRTVFYLPEPLPVYNKLTLGKGGMKKWYEKSGMKITDRQMQLLDVIKKSPMISIKDMADNLKINVSAVQKHVEKLKSKGLLKRVGPDKGGHWKIIIK